ncbi:hypothetical protein ACX80D_12030 [Arthrobacter sp. Sr24]
MMLHQKHLTPELIPLADISEATGIPAAAIHRFTALRLLEADGQCGGDDAFHHSALRPIILLRLMELLGYTPQDMRIHVTQGETVDHVHEVIGHLASQAAMHSTHHPEIDYLLAQLRDPTD